MCNKELDYCTDVSQTGQNKKPLKKCAVVSCNTDATSYEGACRWHANCVQKQQFCISISVESKATTFCSS